MTTSPSLPLLIAALAIAGAALLWFLRNRLSIRPVPRMLRPGQPLPDFTAQDENGNRVRSQDLRGKPAVLLFVRGNWCPFCNRQVAELTEAYRDITARGARLILVTPKPLATTRRVAEFFDVDFEFWLDEDLRIARRLDLLYVGGVPEDARGVYGSDTVWPVALVVDADGVIRYAKLSRFPADHPDAATLLNELQRL